MSFLNSIKNFGKAVVGGIKSVGKALTSVDGLLKVGAGFLTGGFPGMMYSLAKQIPQMNSLTNLFSGFVGKFMNTATDWLSRSGLGGVFGLISNLRNPSQLLAASRDIGNSILNSVGDGVDSARRNAQEIVSKQHASQLLNMF